MKTELLNKGAGTRASGFTLAESMVAVAMGAVLLTALYGGITFSYGTIKLSREDLRATQVLVEQMEKLRLTPYANLGNFTTNIPFGNGSTGAFYTISIATAAPTASDLVSPGVSNPQVYYTDSMLRITATATWTNSNIQRTRILQTFAAKKGIQGYITAPH